MKSCSTCNRTFTDPNLSFCTDDGTPLVIVVEPADETTVVSPSVGESDSPPPTEVYKPRDWQSPDYQPPGLQGSLTTPPRKKTWPWVVGILAVVAIGVIGIGIAGAILVPRMVRTANTSSSSPPVRQSGDFNSNLNSNTPVSNSNQNSSTPDSNSNVNSNAPASTSNNENSDNAIDGHDAIPPPSDKDVVLAALTDLEHDWTVANINADKEKLDRILADDYVGISDGKSEGKADYLRTIERNTTIKDWKFEDLNVNLMRDRATLEGVLRLQLPDREVAFKFADKFVWRDGRWQAVSSEVSQIN